MEKITGRNDSEIHIPLNIYADKISEYIIEGFGNEIIKEIKYVYIISGISYFINDRKAFEITNKYDVSLLFNDRFYIPDWNFNYDKQDSFKDFRRIKSITLDILSLIKDDILKLCEEFLMLGSTLTYDCCHLYNECSDYKYCVREDQQRAHLCTYRRKLNNGIIYYGINRNVD